LSGQGTLIFKDLKNLEILSVLSEFSAGKTCS